MNEQKTVVVLGGYGAVGTAVCEELLRIFSARIVIAGRNLERGQRLAQQLGGQAEAVESNVEKPATYQELLAQASVVVNCVENNNFQIAEYCLANSAHYIDVSATVDVLNQLQTLDSAAKRVHKAVVSSVGVAPGLTNLLAGHALSRMGLLKRADIFVLLGLGERHGAAAIRWTLKQFGNKFSIMSNGAKKEVRAFADGMSTTMPKPFGRRTGYRFDFSDQHTLPTTLEIENVSTWLCFDSRLITKMLSLMAQLRLLSILPLWRWSDTIARVSHRFAMGGTQFAVQVDAVNKDGSERSFALVGDGEAQMTGVVAARVVEHLLNTSAPSGALHLEQVLDLKTLLGKLGDRLILTETE